MQAKWRARVRETRNSRRVRGAQSPSSGYSRSSRVSAGLRSWRSGETARTVQAGVVQERSGAPSAVRSWSFPNPDRRRAGSRTPGSRGSGSADLDPPQGYGPGRADKAHLHHLIYRNLRRALREPRRRRVPVGSDGRRPGLRERSPAHKFTKVSLLPISTTSPTALAPDVRLPPGGGPKGNSTPRCRLGRVLALRALRRGRAPTARQAGAQGLLPATGRLSRPSSVPGRRFREWKRRTIYGTFPG